MACKAIWLKACPLSSPCTCRSLAQRHSVLSISRHLSSQSKEPKNTEAAAESKPKGSEPPQKKKTMAELDEELRQKLEGASGEGGAAGLELEDGKPVSMKRGVKNNMFRYI